MSSARRLYRLYLGLALVGGGAVLVALLVGLTRIRLSVPTPDELLAACQTVVPLESGLGMLLVMFQVALGLAVALLGVRSLRHQLKIQRRFLRGLCTVEERLIDGVSVKVIDGARPTAFCAGLFRPRIYVSRAALTVLTPSELTAVLAHEAHHQSRRDPLRILAARVLADAFFILPALRRMSDRYRQLAEVAADEAAARAGQRSALASALLRFGERAGDAAPVVGIAPERVEHLLGAAPRWQMPVSVFGGSVVIAAAMMGLVLTVPGLVASESVSLATVLAESCMLAMLVAPVAIGGGALWLSRSWVVRRLPLR